ncbi:hypothetical protein O3G_MSEX003827 [Manduca sexta]|uniref:Uncharacterized protein n=1 Tax=Manduca sexta TaxID=7130 RepID=A0A921YV65_MANSE|nr:hypothetical protein O3G_MSEX003827 [Manduca sexta]
MRSSEIHDLTLRCLISGAKALGRRRCDVQITYWLYVFVQGPCHDRVNYAVDMIYYISIRPDRDQTTFSKPDIVSHVSVTSRDQPVYMRFQEAGIIVSTARSNHLSSIVILLDPTQSGHCCVREKKTNNSFTASIIRLKTP